ncbi:T9SS type A sorting domain-containing protein [bacterium]|nr:MAG: T9SS type A sorting domain-containing protein [bacterium]
MFMRKALLLVTFCLMSTMGFAQLKFRALNNYPHGFSDIFSNRDSTITTILNNGMIMYSRDLGKNWETSGSFFSKSTNNSRIRSYRNTIVAPVSQGIDFEVLISLDNGETWESKLTSQITYQFFYDTSFMSDSVFIISGMNGLKVPYLIKTYDGGNTWKELNTPEGASGLNGVVFSDSLNGYVKDLDGLYFKTTNGGETWDSATLPANTYNFDFSSAEKGVALASGTLYETSDSGAQWNNRLTSIASFAIVQGDTMVALSTSQRKFYYTTDRFATKTEKTFLFGQNPYTLGVVNDSTFFGFSSLGMLLSTDYGLTWNVVESQHELPLNDYPKVFTWVNDSVGYSIFSSGTYKSQNNGKNWEKVSTATISSNIKGNRSSFSTENNGVVFTDTHNELFITNNGGNSWTRYQHTFNGDVRKVKMLSAEKGWLVGNELLAMTSDSGKTWTNVSDRIPSEFSDRDINDIDFLDENRGIIISDKKGVAFTTNAGESWTFNNLVSFGNDFRKVQYVSEDVIIAFQGSVYYRTENGGESWEMGTYPVNELMDDFEVVFSNSTTGAISSNTIIYTTDAGKTWTSEAAPTNNGNSMGFNLSNDGSGFFFNQTFISFESEELVTSIEDQLSDSPKKFRLEQNYPNPFNPSTQLRFSLQNASPVTLEVYSIDGRLIQTLLKNKMLTAGSYEIPFQATGLASGVYVYRITSDGVIATQKMTLIK